MPALPAPPPSGPGVRPMGRPASRAFVIVLLLMMAVFAFGGAYYVTRIATRPENRARIQETGPGNSNAAPGFGVTDGAK